MRKSPQNGQTWRNGARRGSDWLGREAFPHPWLVSGDLSQLYNPSLFWGLVLVVWQPCLHLASPGLPHWASNGGPLVSGIDCRYTGCPAAIPIINTRTRMPAHIGKRYLNFPPPILCQRRTHPNLSDTKYNPSIKVNSCQ